MRLRGFERENVRLTRVLEDRFGAFQILNQEAALEPTRAADGLRTLDGLVAVVGQRRLSGRRGTTKSRAYRQQILGAQRSCRKAHDLERCRPSFANRHGCCRPHAQDRIPIELAADRRLALELLRQ